MPDSKGRFLPGEGGRRKGVPNRKTDNLRQTVQKLLEQNSETIMNDLSELDPKSRADLWIRLLEYALPKLSRVEQVEPPTDLEQLMRLSPEERTAKIIELKNKIESDGKSKTA